jgi:hypothetical protein
LPKLVAFPLEDLDQVVFINPAHVIGVKQATDKLVFIAMTGEADNSILTPGKAEVVADKLNRMN